MSGLGHFLHSKTVDDGNSHPGLSVSNEHKIAKSVFQDVDLRQKITLRIAVFVVVLVVLICLVSIYIKNDKKYNPKMKEHVVYLVRQASQWNSISKQDTNLLLKFQHCGYATSCARMAKRLYSSEDIEQISGVNIQELCTLLEEEEMNTMRDIIKDSPYYQPQGDFIMHSGWA